MSGHSKWSSIKHKKAAQDARRGKAFTRLIREISTAARLGGGDPDHNPRLRTAMLGARAANMPSDNIDRAIKKGTGDIPGVMYEEATYEAYGPGGVAILIETLTDNKNRTVAEIRHLLTKHGGSMADAGSVSWMFDPKGLIRVETSEKSEDELLELVLEAGADDMESAEEFLEITTEPQDIEGVKQVLEGAALQILEAEVAKVPKSIVPVTGRDARQLLRLMNAIEDQDDVQKVWANFDIPDEELEAAEQEP